VDEKHTEDEVFRRGVVYALTGFGIFMALLCICRLMFAGYKSM